MNEARSLLETQPPLVPEVRVGGPEAGEDHLVLGPPRLGLRVAAGQDLYPIVFDNNIVIYDENMWRRHARVHMVEGVQVGLEAPRVGRRTHHPEMRRIFLIV